MVAWEIATAMRLAARVVPVLLDDAEMPHFAQLPKPIRKMAKRGAEYVRLHSFTGDIARLAETIELAARD
jgi:hypothetical protein